MVLKISGLDEVSHPVVSLVLARHVSKYSKKIFKQFRTMELCMHINVQCPHITYSKMSK